MNKNEIYEFITGFKTTAVGFSQLRKQYPRLYTRLAEKLGSPTRIGKKTWYDYLFSIKKTPLCSGCNSRTVSFRSFALGYNSYCQTGCHMRDAKHSTRILLKAKGEATKKKQKNTVARRKIVRIQTKIEEYSTSFWSSHRRDEYQIEANPSGSLRVSCLKHGLCWSRWTPATVGANKCQQCENENRRKDFRKELESQKTNLTLLTEGPLFRNTLITARCNIHDNIFISKVGTLLTSRINGCPECRLDKHKITSGSTQRDTLESFSKKSSRLHKHKYDYSKVEYVRSRGIPILITCPDHGDFSTTAFAHLQGVGCPRCSGTISKPHSRLSDFISKILKVPVQNNNRSVLPSGKELDIYLPRQPMAIEINGVYWHSDKFKPRDYHLEVLRQCAEEKIRLFQFTDKEIQDRWTPIRSIIRSALGKNIRVGARTCSLVELTTKKANNFLDKYHLQGRCYGHSVNYGLQDGKGVLLMVASFGRSRFDNEADWELLRLCSKYKFNVVGGASRLIAHFQRCNKSKSLVSYADKRISEGQVYNALGFRFSHATKAGYSYVHRTGRHLSRYQAQKHKLKDILENFDPELSEAKNMTNHGYYRLWDCGQLVFYKDF